MEQPGILLLPDDLPLLPGLGLGRFLLLSKQQQAAMTVVKCESYLARVYLE